VCGVRISSALFQIIFARRTRRCNYRFALDGREPHPSRIAAMCVENVSAYAPERGLADRVGVKLWLSSIKPN
jgi:hypothetical protein